MSSQTSDLAKDSLESVRYTAGTDIGMRREENQDSFGIIKSDLFRLFIVADGMGGVKGGATASGMAVNIIEEMLKDREELTDAALVEAIGVANRMIFEKGSHDSALNGMGTTLVALAFIGSKLIIANVGDSRAYRIRGDRIKRLTEDHTLVMELVRSGTISLEQAGNHPVSHMLTRSLGPTPEVEVDCFESLDSPQKGDRYLLCSDGLYNLVTEPEMFEILNGHPMDEAIEVLIDLANQRGGTDNITIILVELDDSYVQAEGAKNKEQHSLNGSPGASGTAPLSGGEIPGDARSTLDPELDENGSLIDSDRPFEINFDPFAIPTDEEEPLEESPSSDEPEKQSEEEEEKPAGDGSSRVRDNPVIAGAVSMESVAKEAGIALEEEEGEASADRPEAEAQTAPRFSNKALIALGILAGFLGGGLAVVLISGNTAKTRSSVMIHTLPSVPETTVLNPRLAGIEAGSETSQPLIEPQAQLPDIPELASVQPLSDPGDSVAVAPKYAESQGDASTAGGGATAEHLRRRAEELSNRITEMQSRITMFERPLSGESGKLLQNESEKREELKAQLTTLQADVDTATRKLTVWYGRRTRLQEADLTNLATEVAISALEVKEKKEIFELATWEYLKEAEVLRYLPTDRLQKKKVDELAELRNRRLHELTDAVHSAIDREIQNSEAQITSLTLQREKISEEIEALDHNISFVKVLMSGDEERKSAKRKEIEKELRITESELKEVNQLLSQLESAQSAKTHQAPDLLDGEP
ncbi:MAG: Stp1/IreP family PP2C-type Ser/Thr phosphatase [Deltaproteobacteria bacterium]|nr:Stp1/IreP family PP2C-type Ser/Thr phosphatase [Deltaproteobacteria bacterium]